MAKWVILSLTPLDLAPDEAYYWDWSRNLDYHYYSKGPVVALLIRASVSLFGDTALAVRAPGFLSAVLFSFGFYLIVRFLCSGATSFVTWLALQTTVFYFVLGLVMTTDPAFLFFWLLSLGGGIAAIRSKNSNYWLIVGVAIALGILAKLTALLFLIGLAIFFLCCREERCQIKTKGFIFGSLFPIAAIGLMLIWNMTHQWVGVLHNASHLSGGKAMALNAKHLLALLGGQIGLIGPFLFVASVGAYGIAATKLRQCDAISQLVFWTGAPLGALCFLLSWFRPVYANWPVPIYIGGLLLLAHLYSTGQMTEKPWSRKAGWSFAINTLLLGLAVLPILGLTLGLPANNLPTKKLVGWSELGLIAADEIDKLVEKEEGEIFVSSPDYEISAELAFYLPSHPKTYVLPGTTRRMNQYDLWGGWEKLRGQNALIVTKTPELSDSAVKLFEKVSRLERIYTVQYSGEELRTFYFFYAEKLREDIINGAMAY